MDDPASRMLTAALTMEAIGVMAILQLLTEDRILLGLDPHGGGTTRRVLDILAGWDRMACSDPAPGLPWDKQAAKSRAALSKAVASTAPLMSVIAALSVTEPH